uniref:Uncharacterized protein n=1 Tax=Mus spicilegus TaxID=10103 RepID=A0A8C6H1P3_MUSSI
MGRTWGTATITDVPVTLQLLQRRPLFAETILRGRGRSPGGSRRQELLEGAGGRARGTAAPHPVHRGRRAAAQAALDLPQPPEGFQEARRLGAPRAAGPRHGAGWAEDTRADTTRQAGPRRPPSHPRPDPPLRREGPAALRPTPRTSGRHDTGSRNALGPSSRKWEKANPRG